jgi:hypothetical protein
MQKLMQSSETRLRLLKSMREDVFRSINERFSTVLLNRNFLGGLRVDHETNEVSLEVNTQPVAGESAVVTDSRQVCLIDAVEV